jgi:hypothetical protein
MQGVACCGFFVSAASTGAHAWSVFVTSIAVLVGLQGAARVAGTVIPWHQHEFLQSCGPRVSTAPFQIQWRPQYPKTSIEFPGWVLDIMTGLLPKGIDDLPWCSTE